MMTRPVSPTKRDAINPVSQRPAASSSTVSPGCGSSLLIIHSLTGRELSHISSRCVYQPVATASQVSLLLWRVASGCAGISPDDVMSLSFIVSLLHQVLED